jgi:hypothetical protein
MSKLKSTLTKFAFQLKMFKLCNLYICIYATEIINYSLLTFGYFEFNFRVHFIFYLSDN